MSRPLLEVIALDVEDAVAARTGGADRLELVTDMAADGLTPSLSIFAAVRAAVDLPIRVMLRPRDGFAVGGAADLERLCATAAALREAGADEFVLGFLDADGEADLPAIGALLAVLGEVRWTFHRALDHARDRGAVRRAVDGLPGLDTLLTAGSAAGVDAGLGVLREEAAQTAAPPPAPRPRPGPRVMVGGGLRLDHLPALRAAGLKAFHIGGAARPNGWAGPVCAEAVRTWRRALDTPTPATPPVPATAG
ncbi:copper homeostasis protein CutC [Streptomyces sp. ST2-7A]|uniref:copper homeostasis protein CutC n=1 Tax=Streptomyces sp. ST2-7A TaxID=2907214 RepID=UPI001F34CBF9|nr:copper homeostasis protein CutC [Streptomyces sp. ST2-7A]MCE7080179.1 copper homeostasis protein CutC [Streptomyces sp. ST2-7A]